MITYTRTPCICKTIYIMCIKICNALSFVSFYNNFCSTIYFFNHKRINKYIIYTFLLCTVYVFMIWYLYLWSDKYIYNIFFLSQILLKLYSKSCDFEYWEYKMDSSIAYSCETQPKICLRFFIVCSIYVRYLITFIIKQCLDFTVLNVYV